ncbi:MAG: hypothetical protein M3167_18105 [Acidobacteriota bacterium]|nr:hypothetical protein [Acidobacteriota bacterium]
MLLARIGLALVLELALTAAAVAHGGMRHDFRIVNGRWFDGRTFVRKTMFTVGGVFRSSWEGPVEATIDLHGGYVIPPFRRRAQPRLRSGRARRRGDEGLPHGGRLLRQEPERHFRALGTRRRPTQQAGDHRHRLRARRIDRAGWTSRAGLRFRRRAGRLSRLAKGPDARAGVPRVEDSAALDREWPLLLATKPDFVKTYLEHSEEWERRRNDPAFFGARGLDPSLLPKIVAKAHAAGLRVSTHIATAADFRNALSAGVDEINHLPLESLTEEDAKRAAASKTVIVTTTLSHRKTDGIKDLDGIHQENLKRLRVAGAVLALGLDSHGTVVAEAENIHRLAPFDDAALLDIWTAATARAIFPERKIGCLSDGCEASFLALAGDPLGDFANVRKIAFRMKQGFVLEVVPSVADPIRQAVRDHGADAAAAEYRRLRAEKQEGYDFAEPELNRLGYELLRAGNAKDAAAIFRLNAEAFPQSPNAQDSLADACRAAGDRACEIRAARAVLDLLKTATSLAPEFKRSLEENARKHLEESPNR